MGIRKQIRLRLSDGSVKKAIAPLQEIIQYLADDRAGKHVDAEKARSKRRQKEDIAHKLMADLGILRYESQILKQGFSIRRAIELSVKVKRGQGKYRRKKRNRFDLEYLEPRQITLYCWPCKKKVLRRDFEHHMQVMHAKKTVVVEPTREPQGPIPKHVWGGAFAGTQNCDHCHRKGVHVYQYESDDGGFVLCEICRNEHGLKPKEPNKPLDIMVIAFDGGLCSPR